MAVPVVDPASVGLSAERLALIPPFIEERYLATKKLAGTLVAVSRKGETAFVSCDGLGDVERGVPMAEDTIFRIYSMSKPITSVAIMMLFEEGKMLLEDAVDKFIPSWKDLKVLAGGEFPDFETKEPTRKMQVLDLLRHTSGLIYAMPGRKGIDDAYRAAGILSPGSTLEKMVEELAKIPLAFSPGDAWNYGVSTDVLGYLVQVISGVPFDEFLRTRIFAPLGMVDTDFHVPEAKRSRFAACYIPDAAAGIKLQDDPGKSAYLQPPSLLAGGSGLVSTAADYLRFCHMLVGGGKLDGVRILSRKTVGLMASNFVPGGGDLSSYAFGAGSFSESPYNGIGFGLGFSVLLDGAKAVRIGSRGSYGWGGFASTTFNIDPDEGLVILFLTQLIPSGTYPVSKELASIVYGALDD